MPSPYYRDNPDHWIDRAERMRTIAEGFTNAECRRSLMTIAEQYYVMAAQAQTRLDFQARVAQREALAC